MGWSTSSDLDRFLTAAEGYLTSHAAENTLLLSAAQAAARDKGPPGLLCGWWEPWNGAGPRGAFLHDPAVPLLISGRAPEMAAALAATLAKMGCHIHGVDAPVEVADAFAAAWSQRAGTTTRVHRHSSVYRLTAAAPASSFNPIGRLRMATEADRDLLADWVRAYAMEVAERITAPEETAADLISYGGAYFWEVAHRPKRLLDAAHYLAIPHHRETAQFGEPVHQPVGFATLSRPIAGTVRLSMLYTLPERRHNGYAVALTLALSHAALAGTAPGAAVSGAGAAGGAVPKEVVLVTDRSGPDRRVTRLGYQLVGERAVLRFGPPTAPLPRLRATGPMPRFPTGPLPLPRTRR